MILTGVPYFGPPDVTFEAKAEWGRFSSPEERDRFVEVFNDVSDPRGTLRRTVPSRYQFGFVGREGIRRVIDRPLDVSGPPLAAMRRRALADQTFEGVSWLLAWLPIRPRPGIPPAAVP